MLRIVLVTAVIAGLFILVKSENVLERSGLVGSCAPVATPGTQNGQWWACRSGHLGDAPDLWRESCSRGGRSGDVRYWLCPTSVLQERSNQTR
jgi:hypothetical protein